MAAQQSQRYQQNRDIAYSPGAKNMMAYRTAKRFVLVRRWVWYRLPAFLTLMVISSTAYTIGFAHGAIYLADAADKLFTCQPK